jgi:large subunit ribosomal protein L22
VSDVTAGVKTNERPGTRAQVRYVRVSAYKAREVLDLIRGLHVEEADQVLAFTERDVARVVRKALASAVANARSNDLQEPDTLKVVSCYADEGPTLKRWRPRARGRATRIRKRTCHITIIVARMEADELARWREQHAPGLTTEGGRGGRRRRTPAADRRARVARSRQAQASPADAAEEEGAETDIEDEADVETEADVEEAAAAEPEETHEDSEPQAADAQADEPEAEPEPEVEPEVAEQRPDEEPDESVPEDGNLSDAAIDYLAQLDEDDPGSDSPKPEKETD